MFEQDCVAVFTCNEAFNIVGGSRQIRPAYQDRTCAEALDYRNNCEANCLAREDCNYIAIEEWGCFNTEECTITEMWGSEV